jgi:hypothetical protein
MNADTLEPYPKISAAVRRAESVFPAFLAKFYPQILDKIELCWGEPEALPLFDSYLLDDRSTRQGFPREAMNEITLLKQIHDFFCPSLEFNPYDPFSGSGAIAPPPKAASSINAPPESDAPAASAARHGVWPVARTQRELLDLLQLKSAGKSIYPVQGKLVGEILVHYGLTDKRTLDILQHSQKRAMHKNNRMGAILMDIGVIHQEDLDHALCVQAGVIMVDVLELPVPPDTTKLIPLGEAREKQVVPVCVRNGTLLVAVADPFDFRDKAYFSVLTQLKVEPAYAPRHEILNSFNTRGYSKNTYTGGSSSGGLSLLP